MTLKKRLANVETLKTNPRDQVRRMTHKATQAEINKKEVMAKVARVEA